MTDKLETIKTTNKKKNRCYFCNKKIPLVMRGTPCHCGHEFCSEHRLPETHNCQFDCRSEHLKNAEAKIQEMKCVCDKITRV